MRTIHLPVWGLLPLILLVGCGADPVGLGGACEETEECISPLVCEPNEAGKRLCHHPLGDACEEGATAPYCLPGAECAPDLMGVATCQVSLGEVCDPEAEEAYCLLGSECLEGEGDFTCQVPLGEACDPEMDDPFCALGGECMKQGGDFVCLSPLGGSCDPDDPFCAPGAECLEDGQGDFVCQIPLGGPCDPEAEEPGCVAGLECYPLEGEEGGYCGIPEGGVCDPVADDPYCAPDLICVEQVDGVHACWYRVFLRGTVKEVGSLDPIEGAHVIALDDESVAVTDVAVSGPGGEYSLEIPVVREADGSPSQEALTLRCNAADHQTFPGGLRTALPIIASEAVMGEEGWVIDNPLTEILLLLLPEAEQGMGQVSGSVLAGDGSAGVLVVVEGSGKTRTAISDRGGNYTVFNVAPGSYTVQGYAAGLQLTAVSITMAEIDLEGVDLEPSGQGLVNLSGTIQIVNAPGGSVTTVVLVVESTFSETFGRGEVPQGLRAPRTGPPSIDGSFRIEGVPAGRYVVLAAFENDFLVRDPDLNIAGTDFVTVEVVAGGGEMTLSDSFKVTEALPVVSPGQELPEVVSQAPTLTWGDDSSEDYYTVQVYNAYGDLVWEVLDVPSVSGSTNVSLPYGGPLEPGMFYQFRATSWRGSGGHEAAPISRTEDLRGVFQAGGN